jgi:hypothetical protein
MMQSHLRSCLLFTLSLSLTIGYAQYFQVVNHEEKHSSGEVYSFPILKSATNATVAKKINDHLQNAELSKVIDPVKKGAFSEIWPRDQEMGGTTSYSYDVLQNNDRYLSIQFTAEGCGAYCEGYTTNYNYDSKTGNPILTSSLFSPAGLAFAAQYASRSRNKQINDVIAKLKKETKNGSATEDTPMAIEMFTNCKTGDEDVTSFEYDKLILADDMITLVGSRCSNHAMAALDEIGEFVYELPAGQFGVCFNSYTHQLLNTGQKENSLYNYYKGTINNTINVSMLLEVPSTNRALSGIYFYNRVAGIINVSGSKTGNNLSFTEADDKGVKTGRFDLTLAGNSLTGTWTNLKTKKAMPVKLTAE